MRTSAPASTRTLRRLALLSVVAFAITGCGKSAERQFQEHDLHPVQVRLEQEKGRLSALLQTVRMGNRASARAVDAQVGVITARVEDLARLKAPDSLKKLFSRYVDANRQLATALRRFAGVLSRRGAPATLSGASAAAQLAAGAIIRAQDALDTEMNKHR
jgi:hypothetical protein